MSMTLGHGIAMGVAATAAYAGGGTILAATERTDLDVGGFLGVAGSSIGMMVAAESMQRATAAATGMGYLDGATLGSRMLRGGAAGAGLALFGGGFVMQELIGAVAGKPTPT